MTLDALTPLLRTRDLSDSIEFYTKTLGFRCARFSVQWGWAHLTRDQVGLMLASPTDHEERGTAAFTGSFYFKTDDVDGFWQTLKDRAHICYPIETFEYGLREFAIYDNNGYILQFGQELPSPPSHSDPR